MIGFRLAAVVIAALAAGVASPVRAADEAGHEALISENLSAWEGVGGSMKAWSVADGVLRCDGSRGADHAKWIATKKSYGDFDLTLEFNVPEDSNSGVFIRAPLEGNPAKNGLEVQLFDNDSPKYAQKPRDVWTGSVWNIAPPSEDVHKPAGQWQSLRILCVGEYCGVWHNGRQVVSIRLDDYPELADAHPGLLRRDGRIGLQNHGAPFAFRNIRVRAIDDPSQHPQAPTPDDGRSQNTPPIGFDALFNGKDLSGWTRSKPRPDGEQSGPAGDPAGHWSVADGVIHYDGERGSLFTQRQFGDFILYADWKIEPGGDSGIFPRGAPQVQIWDIKSHKEGSGGLWNNKKTGVGKDPLVPADNPPGQWNTFRIELVGDKVTVHLNGKLVVDQVPMETLRKNDRLIDRGPIVLQHHGHPLWFRNIYIKPIDADATPADR